LSVNIVSTQNNRSIAANVAIGTNPLAGVGVPPGSAVTLIMSLGPLIPDVHDMTVADAAVDLAVEGLVVGSITFVNDPEFAANTIVTQSPLPGGTIAPGGAVNLIVSQGPAPAGLVPAGGGLAQADGSSSILASGFTLRAGALARRAAAPAGTIISQNPTGGSARAAGTAVTLSVSLGTSGLVAAFAFDETSNTTADDSSPVARPGTIRQAVHVPGKFGSALSFDGVN